jgi:superfamily I DNA and/or RNA helicase
LLLKKAYMHRELQETGESVFGHAIVEAGTVHQFQGSEADAVVFDLVDGPGRHKLGLLLRGDTGTRLLNVAISRARAKLVVVADRKWCLSADVSTHNRLLARLVFGDIQ